MQEVEMKKIQIVKKKEDVVDAEFEEVKVSKDDKKDSA